MNQREWMMRFKEAGAFWRHNGDPAHPHAELTTGLHSDSYFNSVMIAADMWRVICEDLARKIRQRDAAFRPDSVFAPADAGIPFARAMAMDQ